MEDVKGKDLSGAGVAPPSSLFRLKSSDVMVRRCRAVGQVERDEACSSSGVLVADRRSAVGSPFAKGSPHDVKGDIAFDNLMAMLVWLGIQGAIEGDRRGLDLVRIIADAHGISARPGHHFHPDRAWQWLKSAAAAKHQVILSGPDGDRAEEGDSAPSPLASVRGAIIWLRRHGNLASIAVEQHPALMAGDWAVADICSRWPSHVAREMAAFCWPIRCRGELARLMSTPNAAPVSVVAFEFTGAIRTAHERRWEYKRVMVSVDLRSSLVPGPHIQMDVREVLGAKHWVEAYLHPPCTHQVRSNASALVHKMYDGRTFWGIALFIYSLCVEADRVIVEQPNTIIPDFYRTPDLVVRPCDAGDADNKPMHLYTRGAWNGLPQPTDNTGVTGHKRLRDFANAEERDRWRSSWARYPKLCEAIVRAGDGAALPAQPIQYSEEVERFAGAWHDAGYPVPMDYQAIDAQPTSAEERQYQSRRGAGDGRRVHGVVPWSRTGVVNAGFSPRGVHLA